MPPPSNLLQIQKLQGKANFLRRFIPNYAELAKGYMRLLKKEVPSSYQKDFNLTIKYASDYKKDFNLYLAATDATIDMVLVQEGNGIEHPVYYFSHNLNDIERKYSYVEKLALAAVQAVHRFRHYILFRKTTILCVTHEDAEKVLNDYCSSTCGGHQSGYATAHKILRAGYFWPTIFKDYIIMVRSCHACQIFYRKTRLPPAPLHLVVVVGPFAKWGIDFMTCKPTSTEGHQYIIVAADYFTNWAEAMPTLNNNGEMTTLLFFNHVVSRFGVPQVIVTDHGSHFHNHMMVELATKLGLSHDNSTPYYLQSNGQVEAINKVLKRMLQRMIGVHKRNWLLILYSALWAYRTSLRNMTRFTPFQLVYGLEVVLPIQCEISSLKLIIDLLPKIS
eukprot:PITA_28747